MNRNGKSRSMHESELSKMFNRLDGATRARAHQSEDTLAPPSPHLSGSPVDGTPDLPRLAGALGASQEQVLPRFKDQAQSIPVEGIEAPVEVVNKGESFSATPRRVFPRFKDQVHSIQNEPNQDSVEVVVVGERRRFVSGQVIEPIAAIIHADHPSPGADYGRTSEEHDSRRSEDKKSPVWLWPATILGGIVVVSVTVGVTAGVIFTQGGGGSDSAPLLEPNPVSPLTSSPTPGTAPVARPPTTTRSPTVRPTPMPRPPPTRRPTRRPTSSPTKQLAESPTLPTSQAVKCADVLTTENRFGLSSKGLDLRAYTEGTLEWIGCPRSEGCDPETFYCEDSPSVIRFGTTASGSDTDALRALIDKDNIFGDNADRGKVPVGSCSSFFNHNWISNAPDTSADAQALCKALRYADGILVRGGSSNLCPEASAVNGNPLQWSSDYVRRVGGGLEFECTL